jgi:flagellar basal-body rod protein FlgB
MIDGLHSTTSLPALERSLQYMSARHRLLTSNLANIETPGYRPTDVSPQAFQAALRDAIDDGRREKGGALVFDDSAPVAFTEEGTVLKPEVLAENIMFHDGNDRSMERIMQKLTENVYTFRMASQMLRNQFESLNMAIRERF